MLTTSLYVSGPDTDFKLKSDKTKKTLQKSDFYLDWFEKTSVPLHEKLPANPTTYSPENPATLLQRLSFDAPKLGGFLRNIGTQVSLSLPVECCM